VSRVRGARSLVPLRESGQFPTGVKEVVAMCVPMAIQLRKGRGMEAKKRLWRLECNRCGFTLGFGEAAKPTCPECGESLHMHSYDPEEIQQDCKESKTNAG
jgi:rRNA maturation endonuclease Nob1